MTCARRRAPGSGSPSRPPRPGRGRPGPAAAAARRPLRPLRSLTASGLPPADAWLVAENSAADVLVDPDVLAVASAYGVRLTGLTGTGVGGKITRWDVD